MIALFRKPVAVAVALLAFALPVQAEMKIQEVTSPGGITAWLVQENGIPFTALEIQFQGGTALDDPAKRGAINLMTALIEEGAGELDAQGFAEARDGLAAEFSFRAGSDSIGVSAKFLTENRDAAVALLKSALITPRFDADAIERVRGQVLAGIRSDAKDPESIAGRVFDAAAFGSHPYASSGDGTAETVAALTRDDVLSAHKGSLARDRIFVAAAGDISPTDLGLLLDTLLGDLPATGLPLPARAEYALKGGITVSDFPGPQSVVYFGHQGIKRNDDDFFAAFILNEILGGGRFGARLMSEVREKRGLTYGIGTYLVPMDHAELFVGQFSASNDKVAEAIDVTKAEWARLATEGVTEEELATTKTYLTGSYPLRFDGNGPIARILVGMQMDNLPIDYAVTRNEKLNAVTLEDMKRVAARVMQPDNLHFVVVGQPTGVTTTP